MTENEVDDSVWPTGMVSGVPVTVTILFVWVCVGFWSSVIVTVSAEAVEPGLPKAEGNPGERDREGVGVGDGHVEVLGGDPGVEAGHGGNGDRQVRRGARGARGGGAGAGRSWSTRRRRCRLRGAERWGRRRSGCAWRSSLVSPSGRREGRPCCSPTNRSN